MHWNAEARTSGVSFLGGILRQLCPRCRRGKIFRYSIFRGFPGMHDECPECGLKFAREHGYFLGAMYISYGLAIVIIPLLAVLLWLVTGWPFEKVVVRACLLFLPLALPIALLSRVIWIYFDRHIDPG
jgi:uncharacterized protein (DUF983 family)